MDRVRHLLSARNRCEKQLLALGCCPRNNSKTRPRWRRCGLSRRRSRLFLRRRHWLKDRDEGENVSENRVAHESALNGNRGEWTGKLSEPNGEGKRSC